jgi:hypothetical protein
VLLQQLVHRLDQLACRRTSWVETVLQMIPLQLDQTHVAWCCAGR